MDSLVLDLLFVLASVLLLLAPVVSTLRRLQKGTPSKSEARANPLDGISSSWSCDCCQSQAAVYKSARMDQTAAAAANAASCCYRVQG